MPARRLLPAFPVAMLLTACAATTEPLIDDPEPTTTETPAPQALELGEFDPDGDFRVFDPCTEIPADVLEAAGLGERVGEPSIDPGRSVTCYFTTSDDHSGGFYGVSGDRVTRDSIRSRGMMIAEETPSEMPGVYWHHMGAPEPDECSAAVATTRGRLVVDHIDSSTVLERSTLCSHATEKLEIIHQLLGESNGNVDRS